jgi:hypothetical protein
MTRTLRLLPLAMIVAAAQAHAADPPVSEAARMHFTAGVNLLRDPDGARYEEAYREFKAAYAASPNYKILGNLGLCAMKLERDGEAIDAYSSYLTHASELDPTEAKQVQTDLMTLKAGVVKVTLDIDPSGSTVNDVRVPVRGERVINQYGPVSGPLHIGIRAGHHIVTVRHAGMDDSVWEFDVAAGASESKKIALAKPSSGAPASSGVAVNGNDTGVTSKRPVPGGVYVGLAITGALAVGGAITGAMAIGKRSDYNNKNDGLHVAEAQNLKDKGGTLNLVTDVLLGGAIVAAGVTGVMYFSRPTSSSASTQPTLLRLGSVGATPDVVVGPHGTMAVMRGTF